MSVGPSDPQATETTEMPAARDTDVAANSRDFFFSIPNTVTPHIEFMLATSDITFSTDFSKGIVREEKETSGFEREIDPHQTVI
jgi:hypothetical protein